MENLTIFCAELSVQQEIFEDLTAVKMSVLVLRFVTPYGLVGRYKRFGGTYFLHLALQNTDVLQIRSDRCFLTRYLGRSMKTGIDL
jgi:hypothetical protein